MKQGVNVVAYTRVSTTDQAANGYGLAAQEAAAREACTQRGWVLTEVLRDEGRSGKDLDRPALSAAFESIASGAASGLVVAKLDRLSRSVSDLMAVLEWFAEAEADLIALDLGIDTSTPSGRLIASIFAALGQWEREAGATRTREGLAVARAEGRAISRPAVADRPQLVKKITRMRARGMTLQAIADRLNREEEPTLRGGTAWRPSSVQSAAGYRRRPPRRRAAELPKISRGPRLPVPQASYEA